MEWETTWVIGFGHALIAFQESLLFLKLKDSILDSLRTLSHELKPGFRATSILPFHLNHYK
jgi:hypothetical protein